MTEVVTIRRGGPVKIEGAEGNKAKVNAEGKLEVTGSGGGGGGGGAVEGEAPSGSPVKGAPVLTGGSDGTDARTFKTDNEGHQEVRVENEPSVHVTNEPVVSISKTAANKEVSVANEPKVNVVNEPSIKLVGAEGHTAKVNAEGKVETTATLTGEVSIGKIEGKAASGSAVTGNPVLVGGSDGTDARTLKVNSEGKLETTSTASSEIDGKQAEAAVNTQNPVVVSGIDGEKKIRTVKTNATGEPEVIVANEPTVKVAGEVTINKTAANKEVAVSNEPTVKVTGEPSIKLIGAEGHVVKVNAEGKLETTGAGGGGGGEVEGKAATGTALKGNPVLVAGSDGTDARNLKTNAEGKLEVEGSLAPSQPKSNKAKESKVEVGAASTEVIGAKERKALMIQNIGKEGCWVSLGKAAATETGFKLEPGATWSAEAAVWTGSVFSICKTAKEAILLATELE